MVNTVDNCRYLSNAAQTDSNSDGVGDDCETDSDGDGTPDYNDTCPFNPSISRTSFKSHFTVDLYPSLNTSSPAWLIKSDEVEVLQTTNSGMPTMLIGMLTLNAPSTTEVVCFSRLLKCLNSLNGKQCEPRSDCSYRGSLFWVHAVASILNMSVMLGNHLQQTTSADDIFRCIFFLGALRVNTSFRSNGKFATVRRHFQVLTPL